MVKKFTNMNEVMKVFTVIIINIVLSILAVFLVGQGNGIEKIKGWSGSKVILGFVLINLAMYIAIAIVNLLIYKFINASKVNFLSSIIQIGIIMIMILHLEFSYKTIWETLRLCDTFYEYSMFFLMMFIVVAELIVCIKIYNNVKCNRKGAIEIYE